jgi:predicted DNA-binding transcriptional regulator AlpA
MNGIWCAEAPDISTKPHKNRRHAPQHLSMAEPPLQTWPKAATYLDLSPSLFDREGAEGRIPSAVPVAATAKGWVGDDLDAWIDDKRSAQAATVNP